MLASKTIFTIHETKRTPYGVFCRRVLCVEDGDKVLIVTPCLRPECPDLGFKFSPTSILQKSHYKDPDHAVVLSDQLKQDLIKKFEQCGELNETDDVFSTSHFAEVAQVTHLAHYQKSLNSLIQEGQ